MKFSIKDFFSKYLVTFIYLVKFNEEILNEKPHVCALRQ